MAASWQDHFHIFDSATPGDSTESNKWKAMAPNLKPRAIPRFTVLAAPQRALDGTLHAHVLTDGDGPIIFTDWEILIRCPTWDNVLTWRNYLGKKQYLIPSLHDPAAHNSYTQHVLVFRMSEIHVPGPTVPVIYVLVQFVDASQ